MTAGSTPHNREKWPPDCKWQPAPKRPFSYEWIRAPDMVSAAASAKEYPKRPTPTPFCSRSSAWRLARATDHNRRRYYAFGCTHPVASTPGAMLSGVLARKHVNLPSRMLSSEALESL